ncbi:MULTISPECIES: DUF2863 family protein [unclassified Janthinobacterium]|uniref:DUF2863 family protein n=1 Tax=unclassified Janthinobacterium TaxID=2610881 RepID=UPI001609810B|nr:MULTISPECIES: DUF2863 family protein [unclassified Janthinobacterium]MBB5607701.1 hypothetical protein [Janthinobacterium sp. S3T4]MBB5613151.1 hypothetical protein [Janthinobacterium sp. S3M3]
MRRPSKDSSHKLTADSQRLVTFAQAIVQAASRLEERSWEHSLDTQLQKLLKTGHQDTIDNTLGSLFKEDLNAYDVLMDSVEAGSESTVIVHEDVRYDALLVAVPILAWTRFSIASGPMASDAHGVLSAHFAAHLLADGTKMAMAPTLYSIDQLPRSHVETYAKTQKLALAALKGTAAKPSAKEAETAPFLADTRYLLVAVVAPTGAPLFRWQTPATQLDFIAERSAALAQWRAQATPTIARMLPGCGLELLLPEAYYVACREADKLIRPVSVRAAVHYLTHTLAIEASELRAVIAGFGEESADGQVDEYRIAFTLRQAPEVIYGIVWPLYGQEDEDGTPIEGLIQVGIAALDKQKTPIDEIIEHLNAAGVTQIKRHTERYVGEYCDDCGAPLFADPVGELAHAEMPEDTPQGDQHFH